MAVSNVSNTAAGSVDFDVDVAVIGGGPGGLTTAAAILSAFGQLIRVQVCSCAQRAASPQLDFTSDTSPSICTLAKALQPLSALRHRPASHVYAMGL